MCAESPPQYKLDFAKSPVANIEHHRRVRARLSRIQAGRLEFFCRQAVRIPLGVGVLCAYIVYMLWGHNRHDLLIGWAVVTWMALAVRAALSSMLKRRKLSELAVQRWTTIMVVICFVNGAFGGSAGLLFFSTSPLAEQAILTMLLCCWAAGAIATSGAIPAAFYAFLVPFLAPIALSWALADMHGSQLTALLIVFFGAYLVVFVRDNGRMITRSLLRRLKNTALVQILSEKRREAEEANLSKSRFLAAASHDLRQPLNALSINSYLLRQSAPDPKTLELATEVEKSVRGLDELFAGLLDISRLDAGTVIAKLQPCTTRSIFEQVVRDHKPVAQAKGLELIVEPCDAVVRTDPLLLSRVVRNIVANAIRYTNTGRVVVRARPEFEWLQIEISDTGVGIARNEIPKIFEEFYQVNNPGRDRELGTGLGLAIVRRYVDLLGCKVEVESQQGEGSLFRVSVPISSVPAAQVSPDDEHDLSDAGLTGLMVLFIDDDKEVQTAMHELLKSWGCSAFIATSYDQAVETVEKHGGSIDLIVADYRLTKGENGIDTVRRLRARYGDVPALIITGDTAPERLAEADASGFPILHKPVAAVPLRRRIEELCDLHG